MTDPASMADDLQTQTMVHPATRVSNSPASARPRGVPQSSRSVRRDEPLRAAQRILSETAHDLQSPLMAVRESVRIVSDGYLGPITDEQRHALLGALECCGDMDELIDNMLRLECLQCGVPRVHRQWIDPSKIAASVAATLRSAGVDKRASVLFDGPTRGRHLLYADSDKLRRLLLNLIGNAIRATPVGGQVLVRSEQIESRGAVRFSVVDQGPGMRPEAWERLARRGESASGRAGLGLAISRQMAALHFANLEIASRPGSGTRIAFELPSAGPVAVADSWCRWRELFSSSRRRPLRRGLVDAPALDPTNSHGEAETDENRGEMSRSKVILSHDGPPPQHPDTVSALSLQLVEATPAPLANQMDAQLQESLRMYELAYRAAERRWVMLWDADRSETLDRVARTNRSLAAAMPAAELSWSDAVQLKVGTRSTRASIRDLFVRDSLGPGHSLPLCDDRRRATAAQPVAEDTPSVVTRRLDDELRRLTTRLGHQRSLMQAQAAAIRIPPAAASS